MFKSVHIDQLKEQMIKKEWVNKKVCDIVDVLCNQCGLSCNRVPDSHKPPFTSFEYIKATESWGYFSNKDEQQHTFHLCEFCYDKLRRTFVIPVDIICMGGACEIDHNAEFLETLKE